MRSVAVVVILAAGCGRINFDELASDDAAACTLGSWSTPVLVPGIGSGLGNDLGMALPGDQLTLIFSSNRINPRSDLFIAQRSTPTGTFSAPQEMTALDTSSDDGDTTLSVDGAHLYFVSDRSGLFEYTLYKCDRTGPSSFGPPTAVAELGFPVGGPSLSDDELELFFNNDNQQMFRSTRPDIGSMWGASTAVTELGDSGYGSLSADGLTLYFETHLSGHGEIYVATRAVKGATFSTPQPVVEINAAFASLSDPFLSTDGRTLYFSGETVIGAGNSIYQSSRDCL